MANILSAIAAYAMQPKKPSIDIERLNPALLIA
jgi:hypothetical protein